jgi:tetratricopeptide (TPR) repeat protein
MIPIMAEIPADRVAAAARALMLAGRWTHAAELLDCASADEGERAVLAVAAAEVAVDKDFWNRTNYGPSSLTRASSAVAEAGGAVVFDLAFVRLKHDYAVELFGSGTGEPSRGPEGRNPRVLDDLAGRAAELVRSAPDAGRRAGAAFYSGLIADILRGDAETGRAWYQEALRVGEEAGDELIVSYALRHLAFRNGDPVEARQMLERSTELRQRAGCVPLVLAQQLALAELARNRGDSAWAQAVAGLVRDWARALEGETWLVLAAEDLLGGQAGQAEQVVEDAVE